MMVNNQGTRFDQISQTTAATAAAENKKQILKFVTVAVPRSAFPSDSLPTFPLTPTSEGAGLVRYIAAATRRQFVWEIQQKRLNHMKQR